MRLLLLNMIVFVSCLGLPARAQPASFHAGIVRIAVPAEQPFDTFVWYPTQNDEIPWKAGPFTISARLKAEVATGPFPVIMLSHGGGSSCGSPLILGDLSAYLARNGFVVVAPIHCKTPFVHRANQIASAFEAVVADPRLKSHIASDRLGMLGFSLGTAVTLELAGGIPNFQHLAMYCSTHPTDVMSCNAGPGHATDAASSVQNDNASNVALLRRLPLKALVLLDPFGVAFQRDGLSAVSMPVLLFRPEQSMLGDENTRTLTADLPHPPQVQHVPGGHFVFTDACSAALKTDAPEICEDPPGVDRAAVHSGVEAQTAKFLHDSL